MKRLCLAAAACLTLVALVSDRITAAAEHWFEIKSPNFTVWADANDGATRTLVWQLEQIRNVAKTLWPWMKVDLTKPLTVIAPRDERSMKALVPQYWEAKGGVHPGSLWVTGPDQSFIVIRSDLRAEDNVMVNPHTSAYFSYANLVFTSSFEGTVPMWLSRGLSGVISNTLVRQNDVLVGAPIPWHLERLRERRLPLRQMLTVTRQSKEFLREDGMRYFDAQSWAFVHYLMFGEQGVNAPRLNAFVAQLEIGQTPDAAFVAAIGHVEDYERAFFVYVNRNLYSAARIRVDAGVDRARFPAKAMSPADSALARASFHATMGRPVEARALVAEVMKADPSNPGGSVIEALLLQREGNMDGAKAAYARAVELGTTNSYALYRSAVLTWRGADDTALEQVEKHLAKAVELSPLYADAHAALGEVRAALKRPQVMVVTPMQRAVALEPSNPWHRLAAARILGRLNAFEEARKAAESALKLADDQEAVRKEAQRILEMLKGRGDPAHLLRACAVRFDLLARPC